MSGTQAAADVTLLRAALDTLAEAVAIHDADGRFVYVNQAMAAVLRVDSPEEVLAMEPGAWAQQWDVFDEEGRPLSPAELPGRRAFAGEAPDPMIVRSVDRRGRTRWMRIMATPLLDADGRVTAAVNVLSDVTAVKDAELSQRFLAEAGKILSASMDLEQTLQDVARLAVPRLADWCGIDLLDDRGRIVPVAIQHSEPEKIALARRLRERYPADPRSPVGIAGVLRTGVPEHAEDITDEQLAAVARDDEHLELLRALGMHGVLIVPLGPDDRPIGTLTLVLSEQERRFGDGDAALARELARRATTAIENARLYSERATIAHTLQAGLLPGALEAPPGYEVAVLFRPAGAANEVGGDFYDLVRLDGHWLAFVGDVAGKGAVAAAVTARARYTIAGVAQTSGDVGEALERLNASLLAQPDHPLCTACCATIAAEGGRVSVSCAGHPPPIRTTATGAEHIACTGSLLGASPSESWGAQDAVLEPGDALVLYTDGVTDAVGATGRFGGDRLLELLSGGPPASADEVVGRLERALDEFRVGPDRDDIAVLVLRRR